MVLRSILHRLINAYAYAIAGAVVGGLVLYVAMQIAYFNFGLDNVRPGALAGGMVGLILGLILPPLRSEERPRTESRNNKLIKAIMYLAVAAMSSTAVAFAFIQGRVHLPRVSRGSDGLDTTRSIAWSDGPIFFTVCLTIWAGLAIGCFYLALLEWSERKSIK